MLFNKYGDNFLIFKMQLNKLRALSKTDKIPLFYKQIVEAWLRCGGAQLNKPSNFYEIRTHILWGNTFIREEKHTLYFENWVKLGILYVRDILIEHGEISDEIIR